MIEQITITGSPADLASFLNSITENVQIHLSIDTENTPNPEEMMDYQVAKRDIDDFLKIDQEQKTENRKKSKTRIR